MKKPLSGKKLAGPIWWVRGSGNSDISSFEKITDDKFLMDGDEIKVRRIVVYAAGEYYKKFVYVEAYPEEQTGLYTNDSAAILDGKVVDLKGKAKLRTRYITPYNFIICAHFSPINSNEYDDMLEMLLNGILKGQNSVEEIVEVVKRMPKHMREM